MKFTDENGGEWESTECADLLHGQTLTKIRRIPRREKTNAEIVEAICSWTHCHPFGPKERHTLEGILDAVDAKVKAKFKEVLDAVDAQERRLLKALNERVRGEKLEGGK